MTNWIDVATRKRGGKQTLYWEPLPDASVSMDHARAMVDMGRGIIMHRHEDGRVVMCYRPLAKPDKKASIYFGAQPAASLDRSSP